MNDDEELHPQCWHDEDNYCYDADYAPRQPRVRRRVTGEWDEHSMLETIMWKHLGIDD
jgi:hypothetical protein